jgi:1-phosphofructokinase family hexose kinase
LILTLTLNPAIDRTILVDKLVFEDRSYIRSSTDSPGGRGINASRVLCDGFATGTLAILPAGGEPGQRMSGLLQEIGFPVEVIRVRSDTRTNLTISDKQGLTIKLNETGGAIEPFELKQIQEAVESRLAQAEWLMLCGSLPPGVPASFYAQLIEIAKQKNVKTFLDTDDTPLLRGLEAKPTVVKPNQHEAERLLGGALLSRARCAEAAKQIQAMGADIALLSLGSRGIMACRGKEIVEVTPPVVDAISPIGAGDAASAAYVWAQSNGLTFAESVKWAVASGTATSMLPGMQFAGKEQSEAILRRVEFRPMR